MSDGGEARAAKDFSNSSRRAGIADPGQGTGPGSSPTRPPRVTRLTLLCHGATEATRRAAFPAVDDALAPRALAGLPLLAARLERHDGCWTSPAACAVATAAGLRLASAGEPLLRDCDYGRWSGLTLAELERTQPDALASWFADPEARPHGGEALAGVVERVRFWLAACAGRPGRTLAVTHPLVIRVAAVLALDVPLAAIWRVDVAPLSMTRLTAQAGRWRLASLNETG